MDIGQSIERGFNTFFEWLPNLIGALVILLIGYIVAKVLQKIVAGVLQRVGFDRFAHSGPVGQWVRRATERPSSLVGVLTFWFVFLGALSLSLTALGIPALTAFVAALYAYLPNVIAAVVIFLVAGAIAAAVATLAKRTMGDTGLGRIVATAAPILVMTIATFMILDQLMIAENIVVITYAALLGAIALGSALAFGLGGREVAREMLQGAYQKGQENKDQWKRDLDRGVERGREEARHTGEEVRGGDGQTTTGYDPAATPPPRPERSV